MSECDFFKWISAELFGLAGFLWGGMDGLLIALLVFMVLDYISGVVIAYKEKRLSSEVGFWGLVKKCMILALVTVGHFMDLHVLGGNSSMFRSVDITDGTFETYQPSLQEQIDDLKAQNQALQNS